MRASVNQHLRLDRVLRRSATTLAAVWLVGAFVVEVALCATGSTYALFSGQVPQKMASLTTLSGDTAFTVSPVPGQLGTYTAGADVGTATPQNVMTIYNKTVNYTRKTNISDLRVELNQDSGASFDVAVYCALLPSGQPQRCDNSAFSLPYGRTAQVSIVGKAGSTPGQVTGYLTIKGLAHYTSGDPDGWYLVLDVKVTGLINPAPVPVVAAVVAQTGQPGEVIPAPGDAAPPPGDPAPAPGDAAPPPEDPAPAPVDPVPPPVDPAPAPVDPAPAPSDPAPAPVDPVPAPGDPALAPSDPAPAPGDIAPVPADSAPPSDSGTATNTTAGSEGQ